MIGTPQENSSSQALDPQGLDWSILGRDKSTFILLAILRKKNEHDIKALMKEVPDSLLGLFDELIAFLERSQFIELTESKIRLKNKEHLHFSIELMGNFFPALARTAAEVALRNFQEKKLGTSFYTHAVARTPKNLEHIKEIDQFLLKKFQEMSAEKADSEDYSCQLLCYTNCQMKMEDAI